MSDNDVPRTAGPRIWGDDTYGILYDPGGGIGSSRTVHVEDYPDLLAELTEACRRHFADVDWKAEGR